MRVVEIRSEAELHEIRCEWNALLEDSASDTIFLTWEWITAWWKAYGNGGQLRILGAFDEQQVLRGLAPMQLREMRRYGQTVPTLSFLGDASNDSDYLDIIAARGYEERVFTAFAKLWKSEMCRGVVLLLNEVPETSPTLPRLERFSKDEEMLAVDSEGPCAVVSLPGSWEEYLATLRPRFRTKIRSVLRNLGSRPEVQFRHCSTPEEVHRLLPILFDLHQRRWEHDGQSGVFRWDHKREFYFALSDQLLERRWLSFSWLEVNGHVLACQYGFRYRNNYYHLQEGYEPDSEHWNAGIGLRAWCMREYIREGVAEYDFLGGIGRHKTDWGATEKRSRHLELAVSSPRNLLFCRGAQWETRVKEAVKRVTPKKLLAMRKPGGAQSVRELAGQMAANTYYHSGLPSLTRHLLSRYEYSTNGVGARWQRRQHPTATIFCYHRVNDDNDPFFPAVPTGVFEQQIRYIARNHKVVSLAKMMDHLESGPPEPVIAVTFDDGYRDNYENAFPVLERYGVPATIFLATGTIDCGEALWFEQLAECIKRADGEFVDFDLEIPRRFWLRNEQERLDAYARIFGLLRKLPDADRRFWLNELLKKLPLNGPRERDGKMLTWDQVRRMKASLIDFGGHTVTHSYLSQLPEEQLCWEVTECKRRIEEQTQSPVSHFAYPNGQANDFTEHSQDLLRRTGYHAAVTTLWGVNYRSTERMCLRRGGPWELDVPMFAAKLDWYQLRNE
jgi:peptidoglycan/xylan/chitin deacetylase (PgdA/CDA1 family)/CelD/BcsL family acetyltransferase involved in cellulose biosynthesis